MQIEAGGFRSPFYWLLVSFFAICTSCVLPSVAFAESISFGSGTINLPASDSVGMTSGVQSVAFPFTVTEDADSILPHVTVAKNGSPSDGLDVEIWSDSGGAPGSPLSGTSHIDSGDITTSCTSVAGTSASIALTNGNSYWLVYTRTGSQDNTDFYWDCFSNNSGGGTQAFYSGSWHSYDSDMYAQLNTSLAGGGGGGGGSESTTTATSTDANVHSSDITFGIAMIIFLMSLSFWSQILNQFFGGRTFAKTRL